VSLSRGAGARKDCSAIDGRWSGRLSQSKPPPCAGPRSAHSMWVRGLGEEFVSRPHGSAEGSAPQVLSFPHVEVGQSSGETRAHLRGPAWPPACRLPTAQPSLLPSASLSPRFSAPTQPCRKDTVLSTFAVRPFIRCFLPVYPSALVCPLCFTRRTFSSFSDFCLTSPSVWLWPDALDWTELTQK
jgi:hypothetical protein